MKNINSKVIAIAVPLLVITTALIVIMLGHLIHAQWVGEQSGNPDPGYVQKTYGLITDAPHATAELFYSTIESVILLSLGYFLGKRALKKQHDELDKEHGYTHD